jgi:hypothetical protein
MKERYHKISKSVPEEEIQKEMEKFYIEVIDSLKPPASLDAKKDPKKKPATRRRSYGEDKPKGKTKSAPKAEAKASEVEAVRPEEHHTEIDVHLNENGLDSFVFISSLIF